MKWAIIVLIMLSLVGSMMWVMPSPRQRFQSKLRLEARKYGFNVSLAQLVFPRATGEVEPEKRNLPVYRMLRNNLEKAERNDWQEWAVARVVSQSNTGLPTGWSWIRGEFEFKSPKLEHIAEWVEALPDEIVAVESNGLQLSLYWTEPGSPGALEGLSKIAVDGIEQKL